jgi:hypothetical protein
MLCGPYPWRRAAPAPLASRLQRSQRADLAHKPAVADDIGSQNGGKAAFHLLPPPAVCTKWLMVSWTPGRGSRGATGNPPGHFRFGSKADSVGRQSYGGFPPDSGHGKQALA